MESLTYNVHGKCSQTSECLIFIAVYNKILAAFVLHSGRLLRHV